MVCVGLAGRYGDFRSTLCLEIAALMSLCILLFSRLVLVLVLTYSQIDLTNRHKHKYSIVDCILLSQACVPIL